MPFGPHSAFSSVVMGRKMPAAITSTPQTAPPTGGGPPSRGCCSAPRSTRSHQQGAVAGKSDSGFHSEVIVAAFAQTYAAAVDSGHEVERDIAMFAIGIAGQLDAPIPDVIDQTDLIAVRIEHRGMFADTFGQAAVIAAAARRLPSAMCIELLLLARCRAALALLPLALAGALLLRFRLGWTVTFGHAASPSYRNGGPHRGGTMRPGTRLTASPRASFLWRRRFTALAERPASGRISCATNIAHGDYPRPNMAIRPRGSYLERNTAIPGVIRRRRM